MIRKIALSDKAEYLSMTASFYSSDAVLHNIPEQYRIDTFQELMRSEEYVMCYILESENKTAGYALLSRTFSQEAGGMVIWIEELYVKPAFRGKGAASEFFEFIEKNLPAARYRLEIEPDNHEAKRLYSKRGYTDLPYGQMIKEKK